MHNFMLHIEKIPDQKLFELCREYGGRARLWRQKFAGLLPEVFRRRLFERHGFGSIFEFAAKLAGMSEEQVRIVLNLGRKFERTPVLKALLENGAVSVNKLARVVSVATQENQEFWADQARLLPKSALETLAKDYRIAYAAECQSGLFEPKAWHKSLPGHELGDKTASLQALKLSAEIIEKLFDLRQKGIDINALLTEFLEKRTMEIAQEKEALAAKTTTAKSRYIPAEIKKLLQKEHGTKCSIYGCQKDAETIHHTQKFALSKNHNPHFLAPLCKNHHIISHSIDVKFHEARAVAGP